MTKKRKWVALGYGWSVVLFIAVMVGLLVFFATFAPFMAFLFDKTTDSAIHGVPPAYYKPLATTVTAFLSDQPLANNPNAQPFALDTLFSQKEWQHLKDITALVSLGKTLLCGFVPFLLLTLGLFLGKKQKALLAKALHRVSSLFLALLGLLGLWVIIDFHSLFVLFHKLLFTND